METKLFSSIQVCSELGVSHTGLRSYLHRYPELRPQHMVGQAYLWTPEEVERLKVHRRERKKRVDN